MGSVNVGGSSRNVQFNKDCEITTPFKIPEGVTNINDYGYKTVVDNMKTVILPKTLINHNGQPFGCSLVHEITTPETLIDMNLFFGNATSLNTVTIKALKPINFDTAFYYCTALETINVNNGFNPEPGFVASQCPLTHDCILSLFNKIATVTVTKRFSIGPTNLAKMSAPEKLIATNKGWTLA